MPVFNKSPGDTLRIYYGQYTHRIIVPVKADSRGDAIQYINKWLDDNVGDDRVIHYDTGYGGDILPPVEIQPGLFYSTLLSKSPDMNMLIKLAWDVHDTDFNRINK